MSELVTQLIEAIRNGEPYPTFPEGLDLDTAERVQVEVVSGLGGSPAGFKCGVGGAAIQEFLGLDGPLLGFLLPDSQLASGATIAANSAMRIECELGIYVTTENEIGAVCGAIELVRPEFSDITDLTGVNLAAANITAESFIAGTPTTWSGSLPDRVTLHRDGVQILDAEFGTALGGPDAALAWLLAETDRRDIERPADVLFITGICGQPLPLDPGDYSADFGALGTIEFTAR